MRRLALVALAATACTGEPATSSLDEAVTVCAAGPTVEGIDVSYYQGAIDWAAVHADGIDFAFIRTSDGVGFEDPRYDENRAGARAAGVLRGTYQFFRPGQDPIAQADLLLARLGDDPDDLPPVLDVEATDGVAPEALAAAVTQWMEYVEAALGEAPIIYTGKYFWNDQVGGAPSGDYPLWIANWGVSCPDLPGAWGDWAFWQTSATGTVAGISGDVDTDVFNGDLAALGGFGGPVPPCGTIEASGGVIDDGDACFRRGGPGASLREVADAGWESSLVWTHTTDDTAEANFARWTLELAEAGDYRVEVYTAAAYAQSRQARYQVRHDGVIEEIVVDQTAVDGWQALGDLTFTAGGDQWIHLGDDTGEPLADNVQLVFDAIRLTRLGGPDVGDDDDDADDASGGCDAGGGGVTGILPVLGVLLMTRRRRTRHV
jgi:uncharacterized protein (TIGR03382 family)